MTEPKAWWKTGVIYQIYPRSYCDTTGNGIGDLQGIINKIPYLDKVLGVDAIWISPFYPSPMKDFGYDVSDYTDIDPLFGNLSDFDRLLSSAHQSGIKIIIDLVPNHTSDQHDWFVESRKSRENPWRGWYVWADPKADGSTPNNWLSIFGGSAWEWDEITGQYYLHSFLKEQPDLNWRNPKVKDAMFNVVQFWLERGVDGFRIDVAHYIMKDPELKDNPLNTTGKIVIHKPLGDYDTQVHLFDKGHPDIHQIYREFRNLLDDFSIDQPRMSMGEIHIFNWDEWSSYYGKDLDEIHLPVNFTLLGAEWTAENIRTLVEEQESVLPGDAWPNYVLGNHDDHRILTRYGMDQARIAAILLLTLRGTPVLYYGDEIGMRDVIIPSDKVQDPAGIRQPGQGRDPNRTPMQWTGGHQAGFSPLESKNPWLPLADDYKKINVEVQLTDPDSMLSFYRTLLRIRRSHPALQSGDYLSVSNGPEGCYFYMREKSKEKLLIGLNFTKEICPVDPTLVHGGKILLSTHSNRKSEISDNLTLQPNEGILILI